ncbi:hypothetical protein AGENTSMITH_97 [Bacillus phage vB_BspM_AgentSmith]|nr:hypothetical protein AGENTSMITH_97 [Bacillus phage vB_BspM_AgentSmith]
MQYLEVFESDYISRTPKTGIIIQRDIPYLRKLYEFNVRKIEEYYLSRKFAVKNTHILSRIMEHFPTHLSYDPHRYLDFASERTMYIAKHFKFTSEMEKGIVHPSYFFGNDGESIIMSNYDHFDMNEAVKGWKTSSVISVLKHNRNDDRMLLPLGRDDGNRSGLDIVSINIPMLALKYREFIKEQIRFLEEGEDAALIKTQFISRHILPFMMKDVVDHTLLNKLMDRFYGRDVVTPKYKHKFKLFEPTMQLDRYLDDTLKVITGRKMDFINIMRNIKLVFNEDMSELLSMSDINPTRQVRWSVFVAKLDYMIFLYDVAYDKGMNQHYINDWKRLVERMINSNEIRKMFSFDIGKDIEEKIQRIREM